MDKESRRIRRLQAKSRKDEELAWQRVGKTPESKLKWLLEFKDKDLASLTRGEREPWGHGLRFLPTSHLIHGGHTGEHLTWTTSGGPMSDKLLGELQQWTRSLFEAISSDPPKPFPLDRPEKIWVERATKIDSKKTRFNLARIFPSADERAAIQDGIVSLIFDAADYLRFCLQCKKPFPAQRKKAYCSPECSQKARDKRRKPK